MINLSEDRILDFLDGRLASPDEEELLHTLSVSPERRQVMREHIKLREVTNSIARQDRFSVPEYVTEDLFVKLEGLGYSAPVSTEALLSRTPEYVSVAATAAVATAVGSGWRIGAMSLLTASIMSFILGAGAYYVFGSSLGLKTRSQELADLKRHAVTKHMASLPITASQFDVAVAEPVSNNMNIGSHRTNGTANATHVNLNIANAPVEAGLIGPLNYGAKEFASSSDNSDANSNNDIPISYTPLVKETYSATVTAPQPLTDLVPFWPSVIPSPLAQEKGTISFQYSGGPGPSSTSVQWGHLAELKFGFTLWDYFTGSASMGFLSSFESASQVTLQQNVKSGNSNYPLAYVVSSSGTNVKTTTLIGLEGGIALDHLGVPLSAMVGFMTSGDGTPYYRGSLMMHFEPLNNMILSAGVEGLFYTHSIQINNQLASNPYPTYLPTVNPSAITSELCGIVGPTISVGWHF